MTPESSAPEPPEPNAPEASGPEPDFSRFGKRGRVIGALALAGVLTLLAINLWPRAAQPVLDCGDLATRPEAQPSPLPHDRHCQLTAQVQNAIVIAMGRTDTEATDPSERLRHVRLFVKLAGDDVIAALPAGREDILKHRGTHGSLFGFAVQGTGRIFDVDQEKGYEGMGRALREKFKVPPERRLWVFDTADQPPN